MGKRETSRISGDECWGEADSVEKNQKVIEQIIRDLIGLGELIVRQIFI